MGDIIAKMKACINIIRLLLGGGDCVRFLGGGRMVDRCYVRYVGTRSQKQSA